MKPGMINSNSARGNAGLSELQKVLVGVFEEEQDAELGMSIVDVCYRVCNEGVTERSVREAIADMTANGLLYATIDEDHYRYVSA